ncbi:MAG: hypothetical protein II852_06990 [Bacteroidales bacterium]|nr:hypothetical protein [Bacteroidales bacterium]
MLESLADKAFPVRYEKRTASTPIFWILGTPFMMIILITAIGLQLGRFQDYVNYILIGYLILSVLFGGAITFFVWKTFNSKKDDDCVSEYFRTEHFFLEAKRLEVDTKKEENRREELRQQAIAINEEQKIKKITELDDLIKQKEIKLKELMDDIERAKNHTYGIGQEDKTRDKKNGQIK